MEMPFLPPRGNPGASFFSLREKSHRRLGIGKSLKSARHFLHDPKPRSYVVEHYRELLAREDYPSDEQLGRLADCLVNQGWVDGNHSQCVACRINFAAVGFSGQILPESTGLISDSTR
jgi:hypothetical protein